MGEYLSIIGLILILQNAAKDYQTQSFPGATIVCATLTPAAWVFSTAEKPFCSNQVVFH